MNTTEHKVTDIAKSLALTTRRVQQLVKENILPAPVSGKYDLVSCIRGYEKYLQQQTTNKNNNAGNLYTQKLRLLKAQADKAELEVQILEEKYIAVSEVELTWSSLILAFRARMLGMPNNLTRQLVALNNDFAAVFQLLEEEIHAALLELSNYSGEEYDNNPEDSKDNSTTAETKGQRMGGSVS